MKVNNYTKRKVKAKLYTWEAYYDPGSGEYEEKWGKEVNLKDLPKDVREVVNFRHDITTWIVPDVIVRVYARDVEKLEGYRVMMGPDYIRWLLDEKFQEAEGEDILDCYLGIYDFPKFT